MKRNYFSITPSKITVSGSKDVVIIVSITLILALAFVFTQAPEIIILLLSMSR